MWKSVVGDEVGEPLTALPIGSLNIDRPSGYPWWDTVPDGDWFVPKNTRAVFNLEAPLDLYLHPEPDDGSRLAVVDVAGNLATHTVPLHGHGRLIEGANPEIGTTSCRDRVCQYG